MKAAVKTADVFVGRVHINVTETEIKHFIEENFEIEVFAVHKLDIISEVYNAFKVCVKAAVRDMLFDPDKWPEDIIVNKFYNKNKRHLTRNNSSSD